MELTWPSESPGSDEEDSVGHSTCSNGSNLERGKRSDSFDVHHLLHDDSTKRTPMKKRLDKDKVIV